MDRNRIDSDRKITPGFIPSFIRARDEYVRQHGLVAASTLQPGEKSPFVMTVWHGSERAFRVARVLTPGQRTPKNGMDIRKALIDGYLNRVESDSFELVARSPAAVAIKQLDDGIERCDFGRDRYYEDQIAYHGSEAALRAAEIIQFAEKPWTKKSRSWHGTLHVEPPTQWCAVLQPDGRVVYWDIRPRDWRNSRMPSKKPRPSRSPTTLAALSAARADQAFQQALRAMRPAQ